MCSPTRGLVHASFVAALLATSANSAAAQVGLQVRSGNLWGAAVEMGALAPVNLRWKWDGVGTPTKVLWQLSTSTSTSTTTRDSDPIAREGALRVPSSGGVYQLFTVTPATGTRLPFYIRVRVENAGKALYSRWITVNAATRAAPVAGTIAPQTTAGLLTDDQPIRVVLTGIHALRTANLSYDINAPHGSGSVRRVEIDGVYVIAASVEYNWTDFAASAVMVKSTPVVALTSGQKFVMQLPIWGPSGSPRLIKGKGDDAVMMLAVMHRYKSEAIAILEAVILGEIRNSLKLAAPGASTMTKEQARLHTLFAFRRGLYTATVKPDVMWPDRPVEWGEEGWAELVGGSGSTLGQQLQAARSGQVAPFEVWFGDEMRAGGWFRLLLEFRR
jgi:hypothetical protein